MAKNHESEDFIQMKFMNWIRKKAREDERFKVAHHIPNGGSRSRSEGARFKILGVVAGIPDVFIPIPNDTYHGLYIEFKTEVGRVTPVQKEVHKVLEENGYNVVVCRSAEEAIDAVERMNYERL